MPRKSAPKPRRVALVGTAPSSAHAPVDDPSWEIWGVGFRGDHITRCTRWFEIHRLDGLRDGPEWRPLLRKWAKDCELVMFWPEPLGPRVLEYPVSEIKDEYGTFFMTSSFSWMLALAIHEHRNGRPIAEVGIWGVDMEYGTEYREQRAGLRHFTALARTYGIPTRLLVNGGVIYEPVPYPFWQDDPLLEKLAHKRRIAAADMKTKTRALEAAENRINQLLAIMDEITTAASAGHYEEGAAHERLAKLERERSGLVSSLPALQRDVAFLEGCIDVVDWQTDYLKP